MSHGEITEEILTKLQKFLHPKNLKEKYFVERNSAFSRNRKMPLPEMIAFLTQRSVNSLDIKIDKWVESLKKEKRRYHLSSSDIKSQTADTGTNFS